jgi:hypothetical protein
MSDQRTQVYQKALADAQSELDEMLAEFNKLASRKDQLEHVMTVLRPLLDAAQSEMAPQSGMTSQAAPAQDFAPLSMRSSELQPVRTLQPLVAPEAQPQFENQFQNSVQGQVQPQFQDFAAAKPVEAAQPEFIRHEEPVVPPAFAEVSQPEQAVVLQQQETPAPPSQSGPSGDRLEDRINFALNFALLS